MSIRAVAEKYQVHPNTVQNDLRWAEREGFFDKADDAIRNRLIPLSIDVIERALKHHLETHETDTAMKILAGVRLLATGPARSEAIQKANADVDEAEVTWERYTAERITQRISNEPTTHASVAPQVGASRTELEDVSAIDAEILRSSGGEEGDGGSARETEP